MAVSSNCTLLVVSLIHLSILTFLQSSGGAYLENSGTRTWAADKFFTGGNAYSDTSKAIANTLDDPLYQSERWGAASYEIPVPTGSYEIIVHLAEM